MKTAFRWIAGNLALMILALILAALAWIVAVEAEDPTVEARYPQGIPIAPQEQPEGMVVVGEFDESVFVTVRTPDSVWRSLEVGDFSATIDLAGLEAGEHRVPVKVTLDRPPSRVIAIEPDSVALELEAGAERTIPVRVEVDGEPSLGYIMRGPLVVPRQVNVSGPGTYVTATVEAVAQVSVQDASADVDTKFLLEPRDSEGEAVPHVALTPRQVSVRIPIELSVYYQPLAIKIILEGQVAPDHHITGISVEPPSVTVFGAPNVIAALPGYIETVPIDIEGAQANVVKQPALSVPQDVTLVPGQQQAEVKVSIEAIQSSLPIEVTPEIQGLEPDQAATIPLETVEIILSGPLHLLDVLEPDDVRVILDLFQLSIGTHQVEPQVVVPEGITAESVLPAIVQVEIVDQTAATSED